MVYQGIFQPIRAFRRSMSVCGARKTNASVVSRAFKWATCATRGHVVSRFVPGCTSWDNEGDGAA
jgi:hypothetical protein